MKILIAIPVYVSNELHLDYIKQTVNSVKFAENEIRVVLINDYCAEEYRDKLGKIAETIDNEQGNILASAWNKGLDIGITENYDYVILSNDDLIFKTDAIDNLVKFANEHRNKTLMWTAAEHESLRGLETAKTDGSFDEHPHFSCFMIDPEDFFAKLSNKEEGTREPYPGRFDENYIPAYFEDGDMHNRILRAGYKALKTSTSLFYHYGSRTIKSDDDLDRKNARTYETNRRYFIEKWGFDPHNRVVENDDPIRFKAKGAFDYD